MYLTKHVKKPWKLLAVGGCVQRAAGHGQRGKNSQWLLHRKGLPLV